MNHSHPSPPLRPRAMLRFFFSLCSLLSVLFFAPLLSCVLLLDYPLYIIIHGGNTREWSSGSISPTVHSRGSSVLPVYPLSPLSLLLHPTFPHSPSPPLLFVCLSIMITSLTTASEACQLFAEKIRLKRFQRNFQLKEITPTTRALFPVNDSSGDDNQSAFLDCRENGGSRRTSFRNCASLDKPRIQVSYGREVEVSLHFHRRSSGSFSTTDQENPFFSG